MRASSPEVPPSEAENLLQNLLKAEKAGDFPGFIALGNDRFQNLRKEVFDRVHQAFVKRCDLGDYTLAYMTEVRHQRGSQYLWRMVFADQNEVLVQLWMDKQGKASGFLLTGILPA